MKLVYLIIETFTYADSSDMKLVNHCLDSTFKKWLVHNFNYISGINFDCIVVINKRIFRDQNLCP